MYLAHRNGENDEEEKYCVTADESPAVHDRCRECGDSVCNRALAYITAGCWFTDSCWCWPGCSYWLDGSTEGEVMSDRSKEDWDRILNQAEACNVDEELFKPVEENIPIDWKEVGIILAAYGAMGLLVAATFWMAGFSPEAKAAKFHVDEPKVFLDINIASKHSQELYWLEGDVDGTPFNEDNAGLGIRYELTEVLDVSVGFYDNSFYNTSVYAGMELHTPRKHWVSVGVAMAAVSGYAGTPTATPLIFLPVVQLGPPQMGARFGHMPIGEVKFTTFQLYVGF